MTINEAHKICREYYQLPNPGEDDDFMLTEALDTMSRRIRTSTDLLSKSSMRKWRML